MPVMVRKSKKTKEEQRVMFAVEEIVLSFVGSLVLAFGFVVISTAEGSTFWANFVLGLFVVWLGLLLFTVPLIRKIEELM
jgi:uncharacterized membrane protein YagU involved in acid resistance